MTASIARFEPEMPLTVPPQVVGDGCWISDEARRLGIHVLGGPGSGKSRLAGRLICFTDFLRGAPQVIIDPVGGTIDNFLDRFICLPHAWQEKLLPRIRYTHLAAQDYQDPMPFLYKLTPDEPPAVTAGRYLEVVARTDPYLQTASIEGWNALYETGIYAGILAAAIDGQITDMADLIQQPEAWLKRYQAALPTTYGITRALAHFKFFIDLPADRQRRLAGSLLTKLMPYLVHPDFTTLVAARRPGVAMEQVDTNCLTWLIDGRNLLPSRKKEMLVWALRLVIDYLNHLDVAGRSHPIHLCIDELSQFLGYTSLQNEAIAEDVEELISVVARNYGCNLTICHQSLAQIASERIREAVMSMGTQILGRIASPKDRLYLADYFLTYDPHWVKKKTPCVRGGMRAAGPPK